MTRTGPDGADEPALDALTQHWLRQIAALGFLPHKAHARVVLGEQLRLLVAAARAEPFDPAPARQVGAALVAARVAAPGVLGVSLPLLAERLPGLVGGDEPAVRSRIQPLLGRMADGFTAALRDTAMLAAEELNRSERVAWRDEQRRLQGELNQALLHDVVTDLPNRVSLREHLGAVITTARPDARMSVCLLRVDDFADLNDALGHATGDDLLRTIGVRLREVVADLRGASDRYLLAHLGGEQFVVVVSGTTGVDEGIKLSRLAQHAIGNASLPWVDGYQLRLRTTAGIVEDRVAGTTADDWLRNAHIALAWTDADRRPYAVFDPTRAAEDLRRHRLAVAMPAALERGEFQPHFQPLYALADRSLIGVEALARWRRRGTTATLGPQNFITLAEQTGLIRPLGMSQLRQACQRGSGWHAAGHPLLISVNVSALQLSEPGLVATIDDILDQSGLPASALQLEITESTAVDGPDDTLSDLTDRGIQLAIDDFGTGHANLAALSRLPVTTVKLARELVADLSDTDNAAASAVVHRTIQLCHDLNVTVTAEGIETRTQFDTLRALGCDHGQGFLLAPPTSARDITQLLKAIRTSRP
ncbi:putative bifunctional diguanylate cyclase/phosphodiesterase [Actinoplanes subtropicus]|uniref:putative bifunctional diguanylate cyclase/phosphodiesterase n=1 Tax=Actinoplanes subtropicus TaxID=543632 RepID=UPI0012FA1B32|nr:bifunctional diguanylate cyclase/phosphodiesterase [Actinoplanes subtropicus]